MRLPLLEIGLVTALASASCGSDVRVQPAADSTGSTGGAGTSADAQASASGQTAAATSGVTSGGGGADTTCDETNTLAEAVEAFGACMSYDIWIALGLDGLASAQTVGDGGCLNCHSSGQNNTWLSPDSELTFEMMREFPYVMRLITGTVTSDGCFAGLTPSNRFIDKGVEGCQNPPCHPAYALETPLVNGLAEFVQVTLDQLAAGTCGQQPPPR